MKDKNIFIGLCLIGVLAIMILCTFSMVSIMLPFKYKNYIEDCCNKYRLDCSLVAGLIYSESKFNEKAVSDKGAMGLMQLMPSTAKSFYDGNQSFEDKMLFEPMINIEIGTKYLRYLFDKYADEVTVLACYNAGEGVVRKWMGEGVRLEKTQIRYKETLKYIEKVLNARKFYRHKFI